MVDDLSSRSSSMAWCIIVHENMIVVEIRMVSLQSTMKLDQPMRSRPCLVVSLKEHPVLFALRGDCIKHGQVNDFLPYGFTKFAITLTPRKVMVACGGPRSLVPRYNNFATSSLKVLSGLALVSFI